MMALQLLMAAAGLLQPTVGASSSSHNGIKIKSLATCFWNDHLHGQERLEPCSDPVAIWPANDHTRPTYADQFSMYLQWEVPYIITWEGADPDYPVGISCDFTARDNTTALLNATQGANSVNFTFADLAVNYTNMHENVTMEDVKAHMFTNPLAYLALSQPGGAVAYLGSANTPAFRRSIILHTEHMFVDLDFEIQKQRSMVYDKWKLGVGIGVGVGVPLLILAAFAVGRYPLWKMRPKTKRTGPRWNPKGTT